MIPKVIHYCWFGKNPLPKLAIKCIASWKKYLPDYEVVEWNEDNFDVNIINYTKEAYEEKKYAFVSDYARFWILYNYGGLYFDTDVEIIRPLDEIINRGPFMGCENNSDELKLPLVAPGLGLAATSGMDVYKDLLDTYSTIHFKNSEGNLKTIVAYTVEVFEKYGLSNTNEVQKCAGVYIYPQEYFCPISTVDGKLTITPKTVSIHHYAESWRSPLRRFARKIVLKVGGARLKELLKRIINI